MWTGYLLRLIFPFALAVLLASFARGQDASFRLEATKPQPYTAAYLGNGAIGLETTSLATTPGRCFLAGVYDETSGDTPRIAAAPAWNEVDVFNGVGWLNAQPPSSVENYHQVLDMYDGVLRTSHVWATDGKRIAVHVEQFVSRNRAGAAAVSVTLTPEFAGRIRIRLPLRNWPSPRRYDLARIEKLDPAAQNDPWLIWYPGHLDVSHVGAERAPGHAVLSLQGRTPGTRLDIGEAVALEWPANASLAGIQKDKDGAWAELVVNATSGSALTFKKFVALTRGPGTEGAVAAAKELQKQGWQALLSQSVDAWHQLWNSDIVVDGDPSLERIIHSMLFYLLGSTREDLAMSTPPMGLSSAGYYGHIFWDADTFLFPALLMLHPELARPMVSFRSRTREAALKNAVANGFHGAMYPWEAGPDGAEVTPRFAAQNAKYENHINGDVALAAWQYWLATGDRRWLEQDCWPILRDTADFWVSRVSYNASQKRYEIGKVVAVNESLIGVDNDPWTNAVAQKNLELAIEAARAVKQEPNPKWREIASALYVPSSDSPLLWFPLDKRLAPEQTREALQSALQEIRGGNNGANTTGMMGGEFYPILAAELGDRQLIGQMIGPLSTRYLRPPFQVIAETPRNQNTNFITGAGAFLQQFVFGYSGLRLTANGLEKKFPAVLPPAVSKLTLKNISVRGQRQTLSFSSTAQ